jgi:hypothetical protein
LLTLKACATRSRLIEACQSRKLMSEAEEP